NINSPLPPVKACLFFSSRRRHTRFSRDWSSDVCSSDLDVELSGAADVVNIEMNRVDAQDTERFFPCFHDDSSAGALSTRSMNVYLLFAYSYRSASGCASGCARRNASSSRQLFSIFRMFSYGVRSTPKRRLE